MDNVLSTELNWLGRGCHFLPLGGQIDLVDISVGIGIYELKLSLETWTETQKRSVGAVVQWSAFQRNKALDPGLP